MDMDNELERKGSPYLSAKYHHVFETDKWTKEIPSLNFPKEWDIKIIPPFAGAVLRFIVIKGDARVSVYLDCYDNLGCVGQPYWEIYPYDDDTYRCLMNDTESLLHYIQESIKQQL